eukprot:CAMPEP_0185261192 /NCGR_PEP_ID=MMETSP1359-20130426/9632_1 /TAXON_ID=552665 /ORGANISM="Bigelowiella longifila, Strain CCMP242" /LENGTH=191 /DNA_ID=CAMNT_0027847721 /DNA_START=52 /DNA_END=625 /DNA_ORIENTATION=+
MTPFEVSNFSAAEKGRYLQYAKERLQDLPNEVYKDSGMRESLKWMETSLQHRQRSHRIYTGKHEHSVKKAAPSLVSSTNVVQNDLKSSTLQQKHQQRINYSENDLSIPLSLSSSSSSSSFPKQQWDSINIFSHKNYRKVVFMCASIVIEDERDLHERVLEVLALLKKFITTELEQSDTHDVFKQKNINDLL